MNLAAALFSHVCKKSAFSSRSKERINNSTTEGKKEPEKATKLEFFHCQAWNRHSMQHVAMRKHEELQQVGWDRTERAKGIPGTWKIRKRKSRYCFIGKLNKLLGCSLSFLFILQSGRPAHRTKATGHQQVLHAGCSQEGPKKLPCVLTAPPNRASSRKLTEAQQLHRAEGKEIQQQLSGAG